MINNNDNLLNNIKSNVVSIDMDKNNKVASYTGSQRANSNIGLDLLVNKEKQKITSNIVNEFDITSNIEKNSKLNDRDLEELVDTLDEKRQNENISENISENIFNDRISITSLRSHRSKKHRSFKSQSINLDKIKNNINEKYINENNINVIEEKETNKINNNKDINQKMDYLNDKQSLLLKLNKFKKLGIPLKKDFNYNSNLQEMQFEFSRIKNERATQASIRFQKKMLLACVTGIEFLNNKFDPFEVKLDGWSESVHENITDYDDIFEELHEKYKNRAKMAPELKLMFMLGGSAFMFHLTNTMFKSQMPGMNDIMRQNPQLMQQFANAAMSSINNKNENNLNLNSSKNKINTPFNNINNNNSTIPPPIGVDEILADLESNNSSSNSKNIQLNNTR